MANTRKVDAVFAVARIPALWRPSALMIWIPCSNALNLNLGEGRVRNAGADGLSVHIQHLGKLVLVRPA